MSELLDSVRSRIEALGVNFQFIKTIKTNANGSAVISKSRLPSLIF